MISKFSLKVADELLKNSQFIENLEAQLSNPENDPKFFTALSNFIARDPKLFIKAKVIELLINSYHRDHPDSLKCLSMIFNDNSADELGEEFNIPNTLITILLETRDAEEIKTNVVMALRSCVINKKVFFHQSGLPWRLLLKTLIDASYTKTNECLQFNSIQLLRIMSDVDFMKDEMRKVYKVKLRGIQCLDDDVSRVKNDLLEWLEYKNFKSKEGNKYEKLFI